MKFVFFAIILSVFITEARRYRFIPENITLYLYTLNNFKDPDVISLRRPKLLPQTNYNSKKSNYFVIHDSCENYTSSSVNNYVKNSLLNAIDVNVFVVDYHEPAAIYYIRDQTIVETGLLIGDFIKYMILQYECDESRFVLIGFGMGAHVAGEIGKNLNGKIRAIVALDPTNMTPPNVYVDSYKAEYVQVIHTSTKGLYTALGHADYYPNKAEQPGCKGDAECSHLRAAKYYGESLRDGGFSAVRCDSRESFRKGLCDDNAVSYLGGAKLDTRANGSYFLDTNSAPPYST